MDQTYYRYWHDQMPPSSLFLPSSSLSRTISPLPHLPSITLHRVETHTPWCNLLLCLCSVYFGLFLPEIHFYLIISVYIQGFTDSLLQPVQTKTNKIFNLWLKWNSKVGASRAILKCIIRRKTNIPVLTINSKAFMYISWVQKTL